MNLIFGLSVFPDDASFGKGHHKGISKDYINHSKQYRRRKEEGDRGCMGSG